MKISFFSSQTVQRQITPNGYHNNRDISSPSHNDSDYKYGRFDASALHIAHALKQTEIQKAYNKRREKPIDYYLVSTQKAKRNCLLNFPFILLIFSSLTNYHLQPFFCSSWSFLCSFSIAKRQNKKKWYLLCLQ